MRLQYHILIPFVLLSLLFSCSKSMEKKIEGLWKRNPQSNTKFVIKQGLIIIEKTGRVYATYDFIDKDIIRYTKSSRYQEDSYDIDILLEIEFVTDDYMIFYRKSGNNKRKYLEFHRIKD